MDHPGAATAAIEVIAAGALPPPTTGMTVLTERVVRGLQSAGNVTLWNWSGGLRRGSLAFRAMRTGRVLQSLVRLAWRGRAAANDRLYLVCNSSAGLYATCALVWLARRMGYPVFLHHHVYSYIDEFDRRMQRIDRWLQGAGGHVVHCQKMVDDFRRRYDSRCEFFIVFPSVVSIPIVRSRGAVNRPFRLGHLSNLTMDKGLAEVAGTFAALRAAGYDVTLELAGPVEGAARETLRQVLATDPERIRHAGPVYGEAKARFFAGIDAFLFPTRYRNESWGIVLNEALAAGVPAITYDRGCTRVVVGEKAGLVVPREGDFVAAATEQIRTWIDQPAAYIAASQAAIEWARYLTDEGERTLTDFAAHVFALQAAPETSAAMTERAAPV